MTIEYSSSSPVPKIIFESPQRRTAASYKHALIRHRRKETGLQETLARKEALLCQSNELIRRQALSSQESDHRFLNGLQMIVSLLSLQGRASENTELLRN